jgi:FAD-linked sulfhydryl oxidase
MDSLTLRNADGGRCRTCTSLADFTSSTKKISKTAPPKDCPPDVEELGRSSWTLLHSITATYPEKPSPSEQSNVRQFLGLFGKLYPCWVCAEDFQVFMDQNKVRAESRDEFGKWMCEAHNDVNRKLGKKEFDCAKWEERWRTGWKDGSCD